MPLLIHFRRLPDKGGIHCRMPGVLQLVGDRQQLRLRGAERAQRVIDSQNALVRNGDKLRRAAEIARHRMALHLLGNLRLVLKSLSGDPHILRAHLAGKYFLKGDIGQRFAGGRQDMLRAAGG